MNMKKVAAIVLAATMVMGSSLTAFAADDEGAADGNGKNEGHVDKEVVNVVLPTTQAGQASPFDFITDPERLIQDTAGANAKYDDYTFPDKDTDTGVYFKVGADTYANKSEALQIINKSSVNVTVTVKVKTTAGAKDIPLATSATTSKDNPLYLNLTVGKTGQVVGSTEASVIKTVAGMADNFEVVYEAGDSGEGTYKYAPKASASSWKALELTLDGAISKEYVAASDSTVPTVNVTWSYAKAGDSATVDTNDQVDYITGPSMTISKTGLITITNLTAEKNYKSLKVGQWEVQNDVTWLNDSWDEQTGGTLGVQLGSTWLSSGATLDAVLTLTDDTTITASVTLD